MRLATIHCPNRDCGHEYTTLVDSAAHIAPCPKCEQVNNIDRNRLTGEITGRCQACGRPLDSGHIWSGDVVIGCL